MANKLDIKIDFPKDDELKKMFDMVPILMRHNVSDKAVTAAANIVARKARQKAPRSNGSTDKWSKKMFVDGGTGGSARSRGEKPLHRTIKRVTRKYAANAAGIVGPEWPEGNKAYFNTGPHGRVRKLWGKNPKTLSTIAPQIRNWIVQAFDETKVAQLAAMKKSLQKSMKELWGG